MTGNEEWVLTEEEDSFLLSLAGESEKPGAGSLKACWDEVFRMEARLWAK